METLDCENCGKENEWTEARWEVEGFRRDFEDVPFDIYAPSYAGIAGRCRDCDNIVF